MERPLASAVAIIFANLKGNLGDLALLQAALLHVAREAPESELHVWSHGFLTTDTVRFEAFLKGGPPAFSLIGETAPKFLKKLVKAAIRNGLGPAIHGPLIRFIAGRYDPTAKRFSDYHRIYVVGGDQFDHVAVAPMFGTISAIARYNPRLSCMPVSINPRMLRSVTPSQLKEYLALFDSPVIARDMATHTFLNEHRIQSELGADAALTLNSAIQGIKENHDHSDKIILSLAAPSGQVVDLLKSSIKSLHDQGYEVAAHTTCPPGDRKTLNALHAALELPVHEPLTWQEVVANLKSARIVVSNRLHSLLLAGMAGATVLPVGNRAKTAAFIDETQVGTYANGLTEITPENIFKALETSDLQRQRVQSYIQQGLERLSTVGWREEY